MNFFAYFKVTGILKLEKYNPAKICMPNSSMWMHDLFLQQRNTIFKRFSAGDCIPQISLGNLASY